jgi:hypothetical protein
MSSAQIFRYDAEDVIELLTPMIRNLHSMILPEIGSKVPRGTLPQAQGQDRDGFIVNRGA